MIVSRDTVKEKAEQLLLDMDDLDGCMNKAITLLQNQRQQLKETIKIIGEFNERIR